LRRASAAASQFEIIKHQLRLAVSRVLLEVHILPQGVARLKWQTSLIFGHCQR
jgi:hypothetical protein